MIGFTYHVKWEWIGTSLDYLSLISLKSITPFLSITLNPSIDMVSFYKYQSLIRFEMFELRCVEKRPYAPLRVSYIGGYPTQIFASFLKRRSFDILKTFCLSIGSMSRQFTISSFNRPQDIHISSFSIDSSRHWNVHGELLKLSELVVIFFIYIKKC